ncbi:ComF family protein [Marinitoga hydrogenitolerans]|uniref:ComF family protein n=1 Tax=Marinitoga hydrogenitolerans TaxID=287990 RepID=UPI001160CAA4|nr:ComF family protein [Marinitoga hydrogenitolerans]
MKKTSYNIYFASVYEEPLSSLLKEFKFKENIHLAKIFSKLLYRTYKHYNIEFNEIPEIIYIPSIKRHLKKRGYNPVFLLAKEYSKLTGFNINNKLKIQKRYSKSQVEANNYFERIHQVKNKFFFEGVKEKEYIIIDDVLTTGATLENAIKTINNYVVPIILCKNVKNI